jgi:hypothetical protein
MGDIQSSFKETTKIISRYALKFGDTSTHKPKENIRHYGITHQRRVLEAVVEVSIVVVVIIIIIIITTI